MIPRSAFADGRADLPMAGESAEYATGHRIGRMTAGAAARDFLLFMGEGSRCPRCDTHFYGMTGDCGCTVPGAQALVRGAYVMYGDDALEGAARFMSGGELGVLFATGLRLLDMDGDDVSCQIQPPQ